MNRKISIQPKRLFATLLMLALSTLGLQATLLFPATECACDSKEALEAEVLAPSCCGPRQPAAATEAGCCEAQIDQSCCCAPQRQDCQCPDCGCSDGSDSNSAPSPALPSHENNKIVSTTVVSLAAAVSLRPVEDTRHAVSRRAVPEHAAHSSLQTCIRLSRFTC